MKKIIRRFQNLGERAEHLKQIIEAAPGKAAQLRDTVLMTAGQLQQVRQDVQSSVTGLRADNDDRLVQALREINDSSETFLEAGYELTGVDMDLSPVQRLIVHLEKIESVAESTLRSLLSANSGRQTLYALLVALAKAETVTGKMSLTHLSYRELIVHVGPTPSVRLCWRTDAVYEEADEHPASTRSAATPSSPAPPPLPAFSQSSYFEQRAPGAAPKPPAAPAALASDPASSLAPTAITPTASARHHASQPPPGGDWKQSALDRFKKMPDVSKYRR